MMEFPRAPMCGAGLADGHRQWRQMQEAEPRGETQRQAQSEREKRGLRHSDDGVASSSRPSGAVTPPDGPMRRLGSGQQDRGGMGTDLGAERPRAGLPMPSLRLSPTSNHFSELQQGTDR